MDKKSKYIDPKNIKVGLFDKFERFVTEKDVLEFSKVSGDFNPLHIDHKYAKSTNFTGPIVHGAFQVAMASEFIGMYLPGTQVILTSIQAKFPNPLYYPAKLKVSGEIISWDRTALTGMVKISVLNIDNMVVTADISMGITLHSYKALNLKNTNNTKLNKSINNFTGKKIIAVFGASGGIGRSIVNALKDDFDIICVSRDQEMLNELCSSVGILPLTASIQDDLHKLIGNTLGGRDLYSIIHAAWPSVPKGSLLLGDEDVIDNQILFGSKYVVKLAKCLYSFSNGCGGRLIALGSTYAKLEASPTMPAYSLGKSIMEDTIRILAPELARMNITANVISPSFTATGMNSTVPERILVKLAEKVPMGRLCSNEDIVSIIQYLLQPNATFISGQSIAVSGAKR